jgi:hypothetical protein
MPSYQLIYLAELLGRLKAGSPQTMTEPGAFIKRLYIAFRLAWSVEFQISSILRALVREQAMAAGMTGERSS